MADVTQIGGAMIPLLLATNNAGKRTELRALLGDRFSVRTLDELGIVSPIETGLTFAMNAELKARHAADLGSMLTLADDSGLQVEALNGEPGVRSARYAGEPPDDARNRALLLLKMSDVSTERRTAQFVCSMTVALPGQLIGRGQGTCMGTIARRERGENGFGYDSVFVLPDGRTMAELAPAEKSTISHRALALRRVLPILEALLAGERR